jgi:hypothetical protein
VVQIHPWCRYIRGVHIHDHDADHALSHDSSNSFISHDFSRGADTVVVQIHPWCRYIRGVHIHDYDADHALSHDSSISHDFSRGGRHIRGADFSRGTDTVVAQRQSWHRHSRGTDTVVVQTQSWCRRIKGDDTDHTLSHESSISHDFSRGTDTVVVSTHQK